MGLARAGDFSLRLSRYKDTVSVVVTGEVDCSTADQLRCLLRDAIDGQGNVSVVIDLTGAAVIDSAGLLVLTEASNLIREQGGRLVLTRPRRDARKNSSIQDRLDR